MVKTLHIGAFTNVFFAFVVVAAAIAAAFAVVV